MQFRQVPVDGSSKIPDAHMDAIEPLITAELEALFYCISAGFLAEKCDVDAQASQPVRRSGCRLRWAMHCGHGARICYCYTLVAGAMWIWAGALCSVPVWMLHAVEQRTELPFLQ